MVQIITDSAADFEPDELELLNVSCIPMTVTFGNVTYKENINLTKRIFYNLLKMQNEFPVTSQPSPHQFEIAFKKAAENGKEIVAIFLSSKLSGTYQGAKFVSSSFSHKNCYIIDSLNASAGQRILVEEAVRLRNMGKSAKEIADNLEILKKKIRLYACLDTLEYLEKGGRISHSSAKIASIANVKPVITVEKGKVQLKHKSLGMQRGIKYMEKQLNSFPPDLQYPFHILYSHSHSQGVALKESLMKSGYQITNHSLVNVGAVVGSHIGANACGIAYVEK